MTTDLQQFILGYIDIPKKDLMNIVGMFKVKEFKKDEYLLRQGNICKDFIYLKSGCTRLYYIKDGVEISIWFALPNSVASEIHSFIGQKPSGFFVQAVKDCEVLYISKVELEKFYLIYPKIQELMRKFWEDTLLHIIQRFSSLQNDTAEERYLELLKNPYYLQTIPQKYLASFIGVTPTSLSRIRKISVKHICCHRITSLQNSFLNFVKRNKSMATKNEVIAITGGASGIGLAIVKHFTANNTVISMDRNSAKIDKLKTEFPTVISLRVDICNKAEIENAINQIKNQFGKIDMLIHSAGVGKFYDFNITSENEVFNLVETEITTDFIAPILITKKCLPLLTQSTEPKIIYITTGLAYMPDAASPTYCPSKAGLHFFAMSLRHQLKDTNIKVIEVLPAAVDTEFSKAINVPKISTEKFVKIFIAKLNNGRTTIRIGMANVLYILSRFFPTFAFKIINGKK